MKKIKTVNYGPLSETDLLGFLKLQRKSCKVLGQHAWADVYRQLELTIRNGKVGRKNPWDTKRKVMVAKLRIENKQLKNKLDKVNKAMSCLQNIKM